MSERMNMVQERTVPKKYAEKGVREFWLHPDYRWIITYDAEGMPVLQGIPLEEFKTFGGPPFKGPKHMAITAMRFHIRMAGVDHKAVGDLSDKTVVRLFNRMFALQEYIGIDVQGKEVTP